MPANSSSFELPRIPGPSNISSDHGPKLSSHRFPVPPQDGSLQGLRRTNIGYPQEEMGWEKEDPRVLTPKRFCCLDHTVGTETEEREGYEREISSTCRSCTFFLPWAIHTSILDSMYHMWSTVVYHQPPSSSIQSIPTLDSSKNPRVHNRHSELL